MREKAAVERCGRCAAELSDGETEGLCAGCLLETGLDASLLLSNRKRHGKPAMSSFGDYELLEEIARGGMGIVYRARQVSLNRTVAVKMILDGALAGEADRRRFQAEAEAAARLQHPNIVAIHEVGEQDGHAFFSMDFVEGRDLAELAQSEPLPARQAAQIVKTIAEAVHYAHSRGVLHRDLKPSNILIDETGQPRVMDFGLAKCLDQGQDLTLTGQVIGSPSYMPPEQATGQHGAIGPASDVYSLGAVLYRLVTGRAPFVGQTITQTLRLVTETEAVSPRLLNPEIALDLETICLKCLSKETRHRYENAQSLANDLDLYLRNLPISARPATRLEKLTRWSQRNPSLATAAGVVLVLLVTVAIGSVAAMLRISQEAQRAEQHAKKEERQRQLAEANERKAQSESVKSREVARFLQDMLGGVRPAVAMGRDTTLLREILEKSYSRLGKELTNQPTVDAELRATIATVYYGLGDFKKAEALHREALSLRHQTFGNVHLDVAASLDSLASTLGEMRKGKEGEACSREALDIKQKLLGSENLEVAKSLHNTGAMLEYQDRSAEAEPYYRESIRLRRKFLGNEHRDIGVSLNGAGNVAKAEGKMAEAEFFYHECIAIFRKIDGTNSPDQEVPLTNLAMLLLDVGRFEEAEKIAREGLALKRRVLSTNHPHISRSLSLVMYALERQGRIPEAISCATELVEVRKAQPIDGRDNVSKALKELTRLLEKAGGQQQQLQAALPSLAYYQSNELGDQHPDTVATLTKLAWLRATNGSVPEAINVGGKNLQISHKTLGEIRARHRDYDGAITAYKRAVELDPESARSHSSLCALYAFRTDVENYRRCCDRFINQFAGTTNAGNADRIAKACLILESPTNLRLAGSLADKAISLGKGSELLPWFHFCKSLAEYRQGNAKSAADWAQKALLKKGTLLERDACALLVLSMAQKQIEEDAGARDSLQQASAILDTRLPGVGGGDLGAQWVDVLIASILRREAEALIIKGGPLETKSLTP